MLISGIGSALSYLPGSYASTAELTELCRVAAGYNGCYTSHIRSEGDHLHGALTAVHGCNGTSWTPSWHF